MSEQGGRNIGKTIQKAITGIALYYVVAIGLTIGMIFVAELFSTMFDDVDNPFILVWNATRSLVLLLLVVPINLSILGAAFTIDLVTEILYPLLQGIFDVIGFPVTLTPTDLMTPATTMANLITTQVNTLFPTL